MKQQAQTPITGQQLVADFQSVLLTIATSQAATNEARRSESAVLNELSAASQGTYLNPDTLNHVNGDYAARASLDAHIKMVQAEQLQSMSAAQVQAVIVEDQKAFVGKKVYIKSIDASHKPFDGLWFDARTGYRSNTLKKQSLEGRIEEINFEKNLLVIKPKRFAQLLNTSLQCYFVYVINPETMQPSVEISVR